MQQNPNYIIHDKIFEFYFLHKYVSRRLIILKNYGSNYYFFKFRENENVQKSISSLTIKSSAWNHKQSTDSADLSKAIAQLESVDIAKELESHALLKVWADNNNKITSLTKQKSTLESAMVQGERTLNKYLNELEKLSSKTCPSCEQELHDHKHEEMTAISIKHVEESAVYLDKIKKDLEDIQNSINAIGDQPLKPRTFYELESEILSILSF